MGFTNIAWESRSAAALAGNLTDGPGPTPVGQAGAAWVRIADELADVANDYNRTVDKLKGALVSQSGDAAARRLDDLGRWLAAVSLSAAGNGNRAEQAAAAYTAAVLAMPSVSEAVQARATRDMMASLAAYNGAVLNGQFAEFDELVSLGDASAAEAMYRYEDACNALAEPWDQPGPPDVCSGAALAAEQAKQMQTGRRAGRHDMASLPRMPLPLTPFQPSELISGSNVKSASVKAAAAEPSGPALGGGGYGPMAALARGGGANREHQSSILGETLDGGGEPGAALSSSDVSWMPATHATGEPFTISEVSWRSDAASFDAPMVPDETEIAGYQDQPAGALEQVSDRWVSTPVIGVDKKLTL
ncbi:PPE domain-containing protein [Mycobacterium sp. 3519A]|uniref:PPE domain-containing protein n=1 Tax=Mycobacterium sp. 3519A TaxID=2057184 RepID=UPI000C7E3DCB|nr:PPE domain-containing protein [Mycobacterium sp. 3519A]